jgi:small subunit ribosomal protein S6
MKNYEIMILIHPNQSERIMDIIKKYKDILESRSGKMYRFDDLGKKQLAYQIKKVHKAHYVSINIACDKTTLISLMSSFKFNDAIIRSLILKKNNLNIETNTQNII